MNAPKHWPPPTPRSRPSHCQTSASPPWSCHPPSWFSFDSKIIFFFPFRITILFRRDESLQIFHCCEILSKMSNFQTFEGSVLNDVTLWQIISENIEAVFYFLISVVVMFCIPCDVIFDRSLTDWNRKARQVYKEKKIFSQLSYGLAFCHTLVVRCFDLICRSKSYFKNFGLSVQTIWWWLHQKS